MKVCLFYKKLTQKFWVVEVSLVDGVVLDVQTSDCINRNPNSCVEFKPLDMAEDLSRLVIKHIEEKSSVDGWCLVRPEEEKYHR